MRTDTKRKIIDALSQRPHTRDQIVAMTGLSRATVVNAIRELNLGKVPNTRPIYYTLPLELELPLGERVDKLSHTSRATGSLTLGYRRYDDWAKRWNAVSDEFGALISTLRINPDSDPKKLYVEFTNAAETVASLAYALQQVQGKPDWYTLLGGELEE